MMIFFWERQGRKRVRKEKITEVSDNDQEECSASSFVGCGFFYKRPDLAVTPYHQLTKNQVGKIGLS